MVSLTTAKQGFIRTLRKSQHNLGFLFIRHRDWSSVHRTYILSSFIRHDEISLLLFHECDCSTGIDTMHFLFVIVTLTGFFSLFVPANRHTYSFLSSPELRTIDEWTMWVSFFFSLQHFFFSLHDDLESFKLEYLRTCWSSSNAFIILLLNIIRCHSSSSIKEFTH